MPLCCSFVTPSSNPRQLLAAASNNIHDCVVTSQQRRTILTGPLIATTGTILSTLLDNKAALAADGQLTKLLEQIKEGSKQLEDVPELIKAEKWDPGM